MGAIGMMARRDSRVQVSADDESTVSDIRIGTDGRVHVFGTSREILEALAAIGVRGDGVNERLGKRHPPLLHRSIPAASQSDPRWSLSR